ncbi:MAG: DUF3597 domain-containing protein [Treponema sp.]|nr:DUF3597 domain-containing protein [Treponema sp.]MCL2273087.1 DUF3597 domain-containing protein [Treponema sp.]
MGIFDSIKEKLFGKAAPEPAKTTAAASQPSGQTAAMIAAAMAANKAQAEKVTQAATAAKPVDVEAIIEAAVKAKGVKSNWRESIVDLLKALDIDSSLNARKQLAAELNYKGTDPDGSAEKNIWLHKEVMKKLAENGGKIPAALLK